MSYLKRSCQYWTLQKLVTTIQYGQRRKGCSPSVPKTVQISPENTKKIPTFSQYIVMANAVRKLLDEEMESTIRGMYYATLSTIGDEKNKQKFWNTQENSDDAIKAIELITRVPGKNSVLLPNRRE